MPVPARNAPALIPADLPQAPVEVIVGRPQPQRPGPPQRLLVLADRSGQLGEPAPRQVSLARNQRFLPITSIHKCHWAHALHLTVGPVSSDPRATLGSTAMAGTDARTDN